jgi:hypothetical protein
MNAVAAVVLVLMIAVSLWAWRLRPGRQAAEQFIDIWRLPWGRQLTLDFLGLEVILALWMLSDAMAQGTWLSAILCTATMPVFGSMSAAAYWLLRWM